MVFFPVFHPVQCLLCCPVYRPVRAGKYVSFAGFCECFCGGRAVFGPIGVRISRHQCFKQMRRGGGALEMLIHDE